MCERNRPSLPIPGPIPATDAATPTKIHEENLVFLNITDQENTPLKATINWSGPHS